MTQKILFDDNQARTYRKRTEILAFCSKDPVTFYKSWGDQQLRAGCWIVVSLTADGEVTPEIYGIDAEAFAKTYEPVSSGIPNRYRKKETIQAYQPGHAFEVNTVLKDGYVEVEGSQGRSPETWLVKGPDGEIYPIENDTFEKTYAEVSNN